MNEEEWNRCDSPKWMLDDVQHLCTARKTRLIACACCRRFETLFPDRRSIAFVEAVEQYAEGLISDSVLDQAFFAAKEAAKVTGDELSDSLLGLYGVCADDEYKEPMHGIVAERAISLVADYSLLGRKAERQVQATLVREVVGNPFRPVAFHPAWRTEYTIGIASQMYDSRNFTAMPFLADALEEAGCDSADVLLHCRGSEPHVLGCWAVDLVLDK